MTKSKNTKRALLASVLSMMLCLAMLIGSTFAWFTDSVTSGVNKIVAGNLDVELEYRPVTVNEDGTTTFGEWTPVDPAKSLFKPTEGDGATLWEPGHVETVNLKVANLGTLALTYQLGINIASEKGSTNVNDEAFKLSDYIKFAVLDGEQTFADRDAAIAAADATAVDLSAIAVNEGGVLYPNGKGEAEKLVTLVVYMPTTVGNEANYKTGYDAPEIELGINLVATQTPYENDSFDNQYDKYATYPDAKTVSDVTEFTNAIQSAEDGDIIALADDMILTAPMTINKGITIVGNGNTISGKPITTQADVTFKNVKLSKPESTNKNASLVYAYNGCEELVFDGCTFSDPQWEAMQITSKDLKSVTITNCTFTAANVDGAANSGYGSEADQAIRFIHIQPSNSPVVNIKIANNKFLNCDKIADGVVGIYYVSEESTITVGGNTFEGLEIANGNSGQLSVGWPEVEALKTVSYWTGEEKTFVIDSAASNPLI